MIVESQEIWLRCFLSYIKSIRVRLTPTNHAGHSKTSARILMRFFLYFNVSSRTNIFQFSLFFLSTTFYQVEVILHSPKLEQKGLDRRY